MFEIKKYLVLLLAMLSLFASGCLAAEEEETETWADDLSKDQVISAMPMALTEDTSVADPGAEIQYLTLSWILPMVAWVGDDIQWKVWQKNDDGEWSLVDVTIDVEKAGEEYKFSTHCSVQLVGQRIVYFRVQMIDNNQKQYENIVSFFVYPNDRKLRITLAENSGDASSKLSIGLNEWFLLWDVKDTGLPAVKEVEQDLSSWTTVLFMLEVDFTGWGFDVDKVVRKSNTSWCKALNVAVPTDVTDVEARIQYSFEDLPIEQLSTEPTGYFDYNDLVYYVDILKPEQSDTGL